MLTYYVCIKGNSHGLLSTGGGMEAQAALEPGTPSYTFTSVRYS